MKMQVMAVLDLKAHAFSNPFFIAHEDLAKRAFQEAARKPDNPVGKYPEDHNLYHLGEFDDNSGTFKLLPHPVLIFAGNQLAAQPRANEEAVMTMAQYRAEMARLNAKQAAEEKGEA